MATDSLTPSLPLHEQSSGLSSHLQDRTRQLDATAAAEHRVIEYLLALGLVAVLVAVATTAAASVLPSTSSMSCAKMPRLER
mgnify:CR=1 FL=1